MAMSQAKRSLIRMLVLLGGAGVALYFGVVRTVHEDEAQQKEDEASAKAFDFKSSDAKKVTLTAKGATTVMEKDGDNWRITSPINARADKPTIEALVNKMVDLKAKNLKSAIKEARPEFLVASGADHLGEYGLDHPKFVLTVDHGDGKTDTLTVGNESTYDQSLYYTRNTDGRVYLADSSLKQPLDKGLMDLRDKSIVTHEDKDVQGLAVAGNGVAWSVERDGDNWKLLTPIEDKADKSEVEGILAKFHSTKAKNFPLEQTTTDPVELKKYGFDKPEVEVVFSIGPDKTKKTLEIAQVEDGGVKKAYTRLTDGGPVAEVDPKLIKDVLKNVTVIRDKTVDTFDREKVAKIEFHQAPPGESFTVTRKRVPGPDGGPGTEEFALEGRTEKVKSWKITSAMYTLANLKGVGIAAENTTDMAKYGLDAPKFTYVVSGTDGKELSHILVGNLTPVGGRYYAIKAGGTRVYEVDKSALDAIPKKSEDVLDTEPAAVNTASSAPAKPANMPPRPPLSPPHRPGPLQKPAMPPPHP